MKKIIIGLAIFLFLIFFVMFLLVSSYKNRIEKELKKQDEIIQIYWGKVFKFTDERIGKIKKLSENSNCSDKIQLIKTLDSVQTERKSSEKLMSKNFTDLEMKANEVLIKLNHCNNSESNNVSLKPLNDSISSNAAMYNAIASDINNVYFSFPNNLLLKKLGFSSKRVIRIDYSNKIENEMERYLKTEKWIKEGGKFPE